MRLVFLILVPLVLATDKITYSSAGLIDELDDCISNAADTLMSDTCLFFQNTGEPEAKFIVIESSHCAWQKENKTIHLNTNCANPDVCYELLGRVLDVQQPRDHIARHLNLHFNCTDKCTLGCLNGGKIEDGLCSCRCGYGFTGDRCETLTKKDFFTDSTCGEIDADDRGHVALSTYPSERKRETFCQWLIRSDDPWTVIDAEIEELGLDNEDLSPMVRCNDQLAVYGAQGITTAIPCDNSNNITKLHSTHNWLLIELTTNRFSHGHFKGPSIRYSTRKVQPGIRIYSEGMSATGSILFSVLISTMTLLSVY